MIRTAYPIPSSSPLRQVQLRLEVAARRTRRALQARRQDLAAASSATPISPATTAPAVPAVERNVENVEQEKATLEAFYDQFDALTGLICLAAQEGINEARERRYQAARLWLAEAYPAAIQQGVTHYLGAAKAGIEENGDVFACFWTPLTLTDLLQNDDGCLIERMEQTQNALAAWESALRTHTATRHN